ncbi:MAG TPA: transposase [Terriglobales bacterium]
MSPKGLICASRGCQPAAHKCGPRWAQLQHQATGQPARLFAESPYRTRKSWAQPRRVVAKAEYLDKGENPRFVVTSLSAEQWNAQPLYETFYCARGEMENHIKEQMGLFADRLSTDEMQGNQLRLYFSALAYTLAEALRRLASPAPSGLRPRSIPSAASSSRSVASCT